VLRGIKNYKDVGRLLSLGNQTKMSVWPDDPCNDFRGTDGTIFPPFLSKEENVWAHFPDICRSIGAYYVEAGTVQGMNFFVKKKPSLNQFNKTFHKNQRVINNFID